MNQINRLLARLLPAVLLAAVIQLPAHAGAYEDFIGAVKNDNPDVIVGLLRRGLDPNLIDEQTGDPPLVLALHESARRAFDVLLEARGIDVDAPARNGNTALMLAAYKADLPAVKALLARGAKVNQSGWSALHYAAASGNNDIVKLLLEKGASLNARSPNNTTPLMMAARGGHIMTVKLLLDAGADAMLKNDHEMSAIDFAAQSGHKDIAEGLTYRLQKQGKL